MASGLSLLGEGITVTEEVGGAQLTLGVGTTIISGGTNGRLLYDNVGLLGEFATSISGSNITFPGGLDIASGNGLGWAGRTTLAAPSDGLLRVGNNAGTNNFFLRASAAAATPNIGLGQGDAAAPIAQIISVQSVVAGTANTVGANFTIQGSRSTGNAAGGSIIFQTSPAGGAGSSQNALVTAMTIAGSGAISTVGNIVGGAGIFATGSFGSASSGFLNFSSDGVLRLTNNAGTDFTRLQFGGTSSSFPALTRQSTALQVGLADGSAFTGLHSGVHSIQPGTAIPAGGASGIRLEFTSTSGFGVYAGSGAPTVVAAKGSIYLRSDGSSTSTRLYVATDSAGAWTAVTTAT